VSPGKHRACLADTVADLVTWVTWVTFLGFLHFPASLCFVLVSGHAVG
jgi:hypothetical protein